MASLIFHTVGLFDCAKHDLMKDVIANIREDTAAVHQRLHVHPLMSGLLTNELTLDHYGTVLKAMYLFYQDLEVALEHIDIDCPIVSQDLKHLHQDVRFFSDLPIRKASAEKLNYSLINYDDYLGMRYVLQGSHLGGQVIAKHIHKTLKLSPERGLAFYTSDAKQTALGWRGFMGHLAQKCHNAKRCSQAAQAVFLALETHLWTVWNDDFLVSPQSPDAPLTAAQKSL